jgi:hypothetical protein
MEEEDETVDTGVVGRGGKRGAKVSFSNLAIGRDELMIQTKAKKAVGKKIKKKRTSKSKSATESELTEEDE